MPIDGKSCVERHLEPRAPTDRGHKWQLFLPWMHLPSPRFAPTRPILGANERRQMQVSPGWVLPKAMGKA